MRRLSDIESHFSVGSPIFLLTRGGEILNGFQISAVLLDQVMLSPDPIPGSKQGFTIVGDKLKPNWCEGRRSFRSGFATREQAELSLGR